MGVAYNVEITMDLTHVMNSRSGNLHYIYMADPPEWAWFTVLRMVKPWTEWLMVTFPKPGYERANEKQTEQEYIDLARRISGIPSAHVTVKGVSKWHVTGEMANSYGTGRVLCLGDAVHRHPPLVSSPSLVPAKSVLTG